MERPCVVRPAATSTAGYLGFLAGPTPIGLIAELTGLRGGLGVVIACTALPVLLAGRAHHDPRTASVRRQAADAWPVREEHRKEPPAGAGRGSYASANSGAATSRFANRTAENSDQRVHQRSSRRSSRTCTAGAAPELRPTVGVREPRPRVQMRVQARLRRVRFGSACCNRAWFDLQHFSGSRRTM
jgi:hypothetical protein